MAALSFPRPLAPLNDLTICTGIRQAHDVVDWWLEIAPKAHAMKLACGRNKRKEATDQWDHTGAMRWHHHPSHINSLPQENR